MEALQALLLNLDTRLDAAMETVAAVAAELQRRQQAGEADSGMSKQEFSTLHRSLVKDADPSESELLFGLITNSPLGGRGDVAIRCSVAQQMLQEMRQMAGARGKR